jgi:hypothetical protein
VANIIITAKLADLGVGKGKPLATPNALTVFRDGDKRRVNAMPAVAGDSCSWTIPDTDGNRELLRAYFNDGKYAAVVKDERGSIPFVLGVAESTESAESAEAQDPKRSPGRPKP